MKKNRNLNNLVEFQKLIQGSKHKEKKNIDELLKWRKKLLKKTKFKTKLVNFNNCKDWYLDKNNNITHKSGQFFQVKAVNIKGASKREVNSWSQPILTQKHGGILAFISRFTNQNGVEFLLEGKTEPGDDSDIKFAASFQATQSNINRAHGGKLPRFHDIVIQRKGSKLIYLASHKQKIRSFQIELLKQKLVFFEPNEN